MGKTRIKLGVIGEPAIILSVEGVMPEKKSFNFAHALQDIVFSAKLSGDFISLTKGQALNYQHNLTEKRILELIEIYLVIPVQDRDGRMGSKPKAIENIIINLKSINSIMSLPENDPAWNGLNDVLDRMESGVSIVQPGSPLPPGIKNINPDGKHPKLELLKK